MRRHDSTDDDSPPMENTPSMNAKRQESKKAVMGLLEHFHNFAHHLNEASEQDVCELKGEMETLESHVRHDLDDEISARKKATNTLERRCDELERLLKALQKDHADFRKDHSTSVTHRLDNLENMFGAWADRHTRDVELMRRATDHFGRDVAGLRDAHERHLEVEASLDTAVKGLTSAAEQTAKALAAAKAKLDHMHAGVLGCEQRCAAAESRGANLEEHVHETGRRLDGCLKDLDALRRDHNNMSSQVKQKIADTHDLIQHEAATNKENMDTALAGLTSNHEQMAKALASTKARLDQVHQTALNCEGHLPGLADRVKDAERRLDGHDSDHYSLSNHVKQKHGEISDMVHRHLNEHKDRLEHAVMTLQSNADQTSKAVAAAKAKLEHMQDGTADFEQRCSAMEIKSNTLADRLKETERRLDGALGQNAKELEDLKGDHNHLSHQVKQKLGEATDLLHHHVNTHKARIDNQEEQNGILAAKHDGQARDLRALRDDHTKHGQEIGLLRRHVEGALGEMAHNTAQELKATRDELDQVLLLLAGVQRAWRPAARGGRGSRKSRPSDEVAMEAASPKTPKAGYEVSVDLMRHSAEA